MMVALTKRSEKDVALEAMLHLTVLSELIRSHFSRKIDNSSVAAPEIRAGYQRSEARAISARLHSRVIDALHQRVHHGARVRPNRGVRDGVPLPYC
jgi:hypothetical protein